MFQILLPISADDDHASAATSIVESLPGPTDEIQVTVLNVERKIDVADEGGGASSKEWYDEDKFPESAERTRNRLSDDGIDVTMRREHGEPESVIVSVAEEIDADRIIMAGRKRSPTGKVLFGSVTQAVLLDSDIPVTVITK